MINSFLNTYMVPFFCAYFRFSALALSPLKTSSDLESLSTSAFTFLVNLIREFFLRLLCICLRYKETNQHVCYKKFVENLIDFVKELYEVRKKKSRKKTFLYYDSSLLLGVHSSLLLSCIVYFTTDRVHFNEVIFK